MRFAAALTVAAACVVALGIAMTFAFGGLTFAAALIALGGSVLAGGVAFAQMRPPERGDRIHPAEWLVIAAFILASLRAFLWLLYRDGDKLMILSPNNLGDISLHLDFIRYFASGIPFWPDNPIFASEPLRYPLGADFFNSVLLVAGVPVEQGLVWVGLSGCALTAMALWRWGRGFAMAAFLFGGGLAGFMFVRHWLTGSGDESLTNPEAQLAWKNLFLALFVTQRALLFALPAGLFLLDDWRSRFVRESPPLLPAWASLALYATLPLFSLHSFFYLSIALAGMFCFAASRNARFGALTFVGLAFLPATICVFLVTAGFGTTGGLHILPGWLQADAIPKGATSDAQKIWAQVWFWPENFGFYLVLWAGLAVIAIIRGPRETRAIVLPATFMFLLCAFVSFAVWPWDNTKILIWAWLAVAPCLWTDLIRPLHVAGRAVVCVVLFFSGALFLVTGLDGRHGYVLTKQSLVDTTASAVRDLDPNATIACAPEYAHPLILLGRKIAVGYDGHLWSHGIDYGESMKALGHLIDADPGWENAARKLGADYLYWGRPERQRYPASAHAWRSLPVAARGDGFVIYDLRGLSASQP